MGISGRRHIFNSIVAYSTFNCKSLLICLSPLVVCELLHGRDYIFFVFAFSPSTKCPAHRRCSINIPTNQAWIKDEWIIRMNKCTPSVQEWTYFFWTQAHESNPLMWVFSVEPIDRLIDSLNMYRVPGRFQAMSPYKIKHPLYLWENDSFSTESSVVIFWLVIPTDECWVD